MQGFHHLVFFPFGTTFFCVPWWGFLSEVSVQCSQQFCCVFFSRLLAFLDKCLPLRSGPGLSVCLSSQFLGNVATAAQVGADSPVVSSSPESHWKTHLLPCSPLCPHPPSLTALISGSQGNAPPEASETKQSSVLQHRRAQ